MVQFSGRFLADYATISAPLRRLTKKTEPWRWGISEQQAFDAIKRGLCRNITTAYVDPARVTKVTVDGSPVGVSAILSQLNGNGDPEVICYASRALTPVETRYSQIELEAIAALFPRLDRMVKETIRCCIPCQCNVPEHTRAPLQMTPLPENVWEHLNLDFWDLYRMDHTCSSWLINIHATLLLK